MAQHKCAAVDCEEQIPSQLLMCRPHWFAVPKPIRDEIWRAYRNEGVLSEAYIEAVTAARGSLV